MAHVQGRVARRLVRKLTLALLAGFAVVFAIQAWLSIHEFAEEYEADISRDHRVMGRALAAAVASSLRDHGPEAAVAMIAEANEREAQTKIRWVRLSAAPGSANAPAEVLPPAEKGQDVSMLDRSRGSYGLLYTYKPVVVDGVSTGEVELSQSLEGEQRFTYPTRYRPDARTEPKECAFVHDATSTSVQMPNAHGSPWITQWARICLHLLGT